MATLPIIAFDTSGINALEDGGQQSEPLMKALGCGLEILLTGMSVGEVISTPDPLRREALLARCQRLLASGKCIWPPQEVIRLLVSAHYGNRSGFDWRRVDVRAHVYEHAITRRDFSDDLCVQQRNEQFKVQGEFAKFWKALRPKLDAILAKDPARRPTSYHQALDIARVDGGVLWFIGQGLYGYVTGNRPNEAEIKAFMEVCPPFRAACYGLCGGWYDGALGPLDDRAVAGRNDLMMAVYLPHCGRFVTNDGPQEERLREIVAESELNCEVMSYENCRTSFEGTTR